MELWSALVGVVGVLAGVVLTYVAESKRRASDRLEAAARRAEEHAERRFDLKREAISGMLQATKELEEKVDRAEWLGIVEGDPTAPEDVLEGPDLAAWTADLDRAFLQIELWGNLACRTAASKLTEAMGKWARSMKYADWPDCEKAREEFIEAARADLGIDIHH